MAKIGITETILRDAHQSLLSTRMRTRDMVKGADGVAGTTNVTITTRADGVETPVTISIPNDLEIPTEVDQAAIDSLCSKLAADTGLNLTDEQIRQFHDTLSATLQQTLASASSDIGGKSLKGAMFDLYKLMALLVEVAQKQRDASREMRLAENMAIQKSILARSAAQCRSWRRDSPCTSRARPSTPSSAPRGRPAWTWPVRT